MSSFSSSNSPFHKMRMLPNWGLSPFLPLPAPHLLLAAPFLLHHQDVAYTFTKFSMLLTESSS